MKYLIGIMLIGLLASCGEGATSKVKTSVNSNIVDNRKNAFNLKDYNLSENVDSVHRVRSFPMINKDFIISYDASNLPRIYNSYHFNQEGLLFKTKYYYSDSLINGNEYHIISKSGKIIEFQQESFPEDGFSDSITLNTNTNFNIEFNYSDTLKTETYQFYENDILTKDSSQVPYQIEQFIVNRYEYNDKGLLLNRIEKTYISDKLMEEILDFSYKYIDFDEFGNWTKRIEYLKIFDKHTDINCTLEERTIFYSQ